MGSENIEELRNPPDKNITVKAKSVLISRQPKASESDMHKTIILRFFDKNNPHKLGIFPNRTIIYTNTEKARLMGLNVSYYLEGNDIVINDLEELSISHEGSNIYIKGKQHPIDRRK